MVVKEMKITFVAKDDAISSLQYLQLEIEEKIKELQEMFGEDKFDFRLDFDYHE